MTSALGGKMLLKLIRTSVAICVLLVTFAPSARTGPGSRYWRNPQQRMGYGVVVETLLDPDHYHKYIRPDMSAGQPLDVNVTVSVTSLDKISDADMEYTITFSLYQTWRDSRLDRTASVRGFPQVLTMDGSLGDRLWVPDTYIVNSHTSFIHDVTTRNGLIRLFPNGTVLYVLRITSRVSCPMKLHKYPMDEQVCKLKLGSWSFTDDNVRYHWSKAKLCGFPNGSVTGLDDVVLLRFNITTCSLQTTSQTAELGNYSQLVLQFGLKRNMLFFLMQTYLPSILLVILSWVSFWINMTSVPARVGLGATTVLSMTTLMIGVYNSGPRSTSYIKAVDFYVCVCYGFIFAALMEYAGAHFSLRRCSKKAKLLSTSSNEDAISTDQDSEMGFVPVRNHDVTEKPVEVKLRDKLSIMMNGKDDFSRKNASDKQMFPRSQHEKNEEIKQREVVKEKMVRLRHRATKVEKIDEYSRIIFPLLFLVFNAIYWWVFLTMSN